MFFLDLKKADVAIESGRLDDAFQILETSPDREHRSGQMLIDRLTTALVERAAEHLSAERLDDARQDADKAHQLAGSRHDVAELRQSILTAEQLRTARRQHRQDVLSSARQQLEAGAYSVGADLANALGDEQSVIGIAATKQIAQQVEANKAIVEDAAGRIRLATAASNFEAAIRIVETLNVEQRRHASIAGLLSGIASPLVKRSFKELADGRLDRAAATDELLFPTLADLSDVNELHQCLARCFVIRSHVQANRFSEAQSELAVLGRMIQENSWVKDAEIQIRNVVQELDSVKGGPLGLLAERDATMIIGNRETRKDNEPVKPTPARPTSEIPPHSILQIDGVGRLLLLTPDVVSIGAGATSSVFDLSLMTESLDVPVCIRRDGDDYFAESSSDFGVNGQMVTRKLLASGDTIAVGSRGRLRFLKPVAASSSAVLQITGSRLSRRDVRHVVLMADSLLFGPAGSHFRIPSVATPIVLHRSRSGYALRYLGSPANDPVNNRQSSTIEIGDSIVMDDTRFALTTA